tara:strand:- start:30 stop:281 length:252 start_codon:yes stop_codon:yes gene_type:complete
MTEQERQEIKANPLASLESRPENVNTNDWKNRGRISAKLVPINYSSAFIYFTRMGWSWSSGVNHLIANHPDIQQIQKELKNDA